jgi:hypothetical protein
VPHCPIGLMHPSDAVMGWVEDAIAIPDVASYSIKSYMVGEADKVTGWAYNLGVVQSADGITTICFSRPPDAPDTNCSLPLDITSGG